MIRIASPFLRLLPFGPALAAVLGVSSPLRAAECDNWKTKHPDWIFCDDFESSGAMVATGRYFEYDDNKGDFKPMASVGRQGSRGMRTLWQAGEVEAGNLKLAFGRNPSTYMVKGNRDQEDFREVYYRMYVRSQEGWVGDPYKLSRATVIAKSDWSQAMIAHIWGDQAERLKVDPAKCVDASGKVTCSGYNDFGHLQWIGSKSGTTKPFTGENAGKWMCVEAHVRLNDPGQANGVQEFWIDDKLEARREGLDFVGSYKEYALNGVFLENHWNSGSPKVQERYFDNFVVSTKRISCADGGSSPTPVLPPDRGSLAPTPNEGALAPRTAGQTSWVRWFRGLNGRPHSLTGRALPAQTGEGISDGSAGTGADVGAGSAPTTVP